MYSNIYQIKNDYINNLLFNIIQYIHYIWHCFHKINNNNK